MTHSPTFPGFATLPAGQPPDPLTPEQLSQITHARTRYRKVGRAITVASTDAWTTAIFAGISVLGSLIGFSIPGILLGLAMGVVSYNSFRGFHLLQKLDPDGAKLLGRNQLLLGAILILYAVWNLGLIFFGKADLGISGATSDQLNQLGADWVTNLIQYCYYILYGGIIAFALIVQSLTALYYYSRGKYVQEYLAHTANWVLQMQKTGFKL
ncbi:MAG TPA: hypothetical protein VG722_05270 [Tepidisphaeraceae bacterium]|nr:hypothetical protein [Tepidisphaeraceae bacterium]